MAAINILCFRGTFGFLNVACWYLEKVFRSFLENSQFLRHFSFRKYGCSKLSFRECAIFSESFAGCVRKESCIFLGNFSREAIGAMRISKFLSTTENLPENFEVKWPGRELSPSPPSSGRG
jgi:hypothetical protein